MGSGWSIDIKRGTLAIVAALTLLAWAVISPAALAEEPVNWQLGMQAAASPVRDQIDSLHDKLLFIATAIVLFVLAVLVVIIMRFGAKRHPISSPATGNRLIEVMCLH
jgi:cytochrome c oxidase subunit 2